MSLWDDYELIDSGGLRKFERFGSYSLVRPDPQAIWNPSLPNSRWMDADAVYVRSGSGEGAWSFQRKLPDSWNVTFRELLFKVKPTAFKHTGLFPEQAINWLWFQQLLKQRGGGMFSTFLLIPAVQRLQPLLRELLSVMWMLQRDQ